MTYADFLEKSIRASLRNPHWRLGQTFFNVLVEVRPDLSEQIRSSKLDPFYRDERVQEFLEFVRANWH